MANLRIAVADIHHFTAGRLKIRRHVITLNHGDLSG
jgi:hypothetical protein